MVLQGQLLNVKKETLISVVTKLFFNVFSGWNIFSMLSRYHTTLYWPLYTLLYSLTELNERYLLLALGRSCLSRIIIIISS
jgi:hypothetical protein